MPNSIQTKFHGVSPIEYLKQELHLITEDLQAMSIQMLSQLVMMAEQEQSTLFAEAWRK